VAATAAAATAAAVATATAAAAAVALGTGREEDCHRCFGTPRFSSIYAGVYSIDPPRRGNLNVGS